LFFFSVGIRNTASGGRSSFMVKVSLIKAVVSAIA